MFNKIKVKESITINGDLTKSTYNGMVVDNEDPGIKGDGKPAGRVKVLIPELFGNIPHNYLPWYAVKHSSNASPNSQLSIPPVGCDVVVEFPNNDIYNGIVSYSVISTPPL